MIVFTLKNRTTTAIACFLFILGMLPVTGFSQSKDIKKMMAVMREEEKTWSSGDIDGYVKLYALHDSTRMILSKGAAYGKEKRFTFYNKPGQRKIVSLMHSSAYQTSNL